MSTHKRHARTHARTLHMADAALPLLKNMSVDYVRVAKGDLRGVASLSEVSLGSLSLSSLFLSLSLSLSLPLSLSLSSWEAEACGRSLAACV